CSEANAMKPPPDDTRLPDALRDVAASVRLLLLDVVGVLTDGQIHLDGEGREFKSFHVRDGFGLRQLMAAGIAVAVISGRGSAASATRLAELDIRHVRLACGDKAAALAELLVELGIDPNGMACVGDDVPDLPL